MGDPIPGTGPVMRGLHRPESKGFKASVLKNLVQVDIRTDAGIYLGTGDVMLQEADRILRVLNRIVRGLYARRTHKVLPADWPVSSDLMDPSKLQASSSPSRFASSASAMARFSTTRSTWKMMTERRSFGWSSTTPCTSGATQARRSERSSHGDRPPIA